MPIAANRKYHCEIVGASLYRSAVQQTPGLEILIECEEGSISHTLWLSEKAKANTDKKLRELGVTDAEMKSGAFWGSVDSYLIGKRVRIETEEESYQGKALVRVKWFNADNGGSDNDENLAAFAAQFFGGRSGNPASSVPKPKPRPAAPKTNDPDMELAPAPTDDDIPF